MQLRLRDRRLDEVEEAVETASARLPAGWPYPRLLGRTLVIPGHPDAIEYLCEELEARGLKFLVDRLTDPIRWRGR